MTRQTLDRQIRTKFKHPDGRLLDSIPRKEMRCQVCMNVMMVSESQIVRYHSCCRKFRNDKWGANRHIEEFHKADEPMKVFEKLVEINKQKQDGDNG